MLKVNVFFIISFFLNNKFGDFWDFVLFGGEAASLCLCSSDRDFSLFCLSFDADYSFAVVERYYVQSFLRSFDTYRG